jgi:hypothetical protein
MFSFIEMQVLWFCFCEVFHNNPSLLSLFTLSQEQLFSSYKSPRIAMIIFVLVLLLIAMKLISFASCAEKE